MSCGRFWTDNDESCRHAIPVSHLPTLLICRRHHTGRRRNCSFSRRNDRCCQSLRSPWLPFKQPPMPASTQNTWPNVPRSAANALAPATTASHTASRSRAKAKRSTPRRPNTASIAPNAAKHAQFFAPARARSPARCSNAAPRAATAAPSHAKACPTTSIWPNALAPAATAPKNAVRCRRC